MGAKDLLLTAAVAGTLLTGSNSAFPQDWVQTSAPVTNWSSISMSADGTKMVASVAGGAIYISNDSGHTWTNSSAPSTNWSYVASSADGNTLAAAVSLGAAGCLLFMSTNAGVTWVQSDISEPISPPLAMSGDGNRLSAVSAYDYGRLLYTSTNSGVTWTFTNSPIIMTTSIASSADGNRLVLGGAWSNYGWVYISTNSGGTWILTGVTNRPNRSVASSVDGRTLMAQMDYQWLLQNVFISTNWGTTWRAADLPHSELGWSIACSMDGSTFVAAGIKTTPPSGIVRYFYISRDSGVSWSSATLPETNKFLGFATSGDGKRITACVVGGGIWTSQTTPKPKLDLTPSDSGFLISWIVPSMPFVLQESADLTATNWTDVTTMPILNFTNLHHEVSVPVTSANRFYRLKSL